MAEHDWPTDKAAYLIAALSEIIAHILHGFPIEATSEGCCGA
jgi:hypothetical protein